jgi:hypothetical protein
MRQEVEGCPSDAFAYLVILLILFIYLVPVNATKSADLILANDFMSFVRSQIRGATGRAFRAQI